MENKREFKRTIDKIKKASKEVLLGIVETLLLQDRVEERAVREFMAIVFSFGLLSAGGFVVSFFFRHPPSWVNASIQLIALLGVVIGFIIAITSRQECIAWVIPEGSSKAPYVLFLPSMILLVCGVMTIVTAPLAFVSAFLFSYGIPIKLRIVELQFLSDRLFYLNFLFLQLSAMIQKAMLAVIKRRQNARSIHMCKMRIAKGLLVLAISILFLVLGSKESFRRFTFIFIPSLLIWYALLSTWWEPVDEPVDEKERGLIWALSYSIGFLPLVLLTIYVISLLFIIHVMPYLPQEPFMIPFW